MTNSASTLSGPTLNILLVVRWPVGGIRTFLRYVINELPANQFCFSIVAVETEGMKALRDELGDRLSACVTVEPDGKEERSMVKAVLETMREQKFDLIHAHGFTSNIVSLFPSIFLKTPLLCTSHDVINSNQFEGVKGWLKMRLLEFSLRHCKAIHSVSRDAQDNLSSFFPRIKENRKHIIFNGVKTQQFLGAKPQNVHDIAKIDYEIPIIGFFGRFMGQKGFRILIDAVELIRNELLLPRVHVVCFGSGAFIREEQIEIEKRGLSSDFSFIPFTADVSGMMKGCDAIAMPSFWEACPLQPMEALSAGVPFVGSDCIGLREVIKNTPAKMVPVGDSAALARALVELLSAGKSEFEKFAPEAADRFNITNTIFDIENLYLRVLSNER